MEVLHYTAPNQIVPYPVAVQRLAAAMGQVKAELKQKERQLALQAVHAHEQNQQLQALRQQVRALAQATKGKTARQLAAIEKQLANALPPANSWDTFALQFEQVHPQFFARLKARYPALTPNDLRMAAYLKMGMDNKEIARLCGIALCTVKSNINRLKKRMALPAHVAIREVVLNL